MNPRSELVLIHAPFGRDAQLICRVLESADITTQSCSTFEDTCAALANDVGALLIADEALTTLRVSELAKISSFATAMVRSRHSCHDQWRAHNGR